MLFAENYEINKVGDPVIESSVMIELLSEIESINNLSEYERMCIYTNNQEYVFHEIKSIDITTDIIRINTCYNLISIDTYTIEAFELSL